MLLTTFTVNNPNDFIIPGLTNMREAVALANANAGADTIVNATNSIFGASITITDSLTIEGGVITNGRLNVVSDGSLNPLTVRGTIFVGGGIDIVGNGLTVEDSSFQNAANRAINANNVTMTVTNSTFVGSRTLAGFGGGAIRANNSNVTVVGGSFVGNQALIGGAIEIDGDRTLTISGGTQFTQNATTGADPRGGGAIAIRDGATATIRDASFAQNTAGFGGAVSVIAGGSAVVRGSTFLQNEATGSGGAISATGTGSLRVTDSTFTENATSEVGGRGGAIAARSMTAPDAVVRIFSSSFTGNSVDFVGGAVDFQNVADAVISTSEFLGNISTSAFAAGGGAVSYERSAGVIRLSAFGIGLDGDETNAQANQGALGGALLTFEESTLRVVGSDFYGNAATSEGGGFDVNGFEDTVTFVRSVFEKNTALGRGGGGVTRGGTTVIRNSVFAENEAERGAGLAKTAFGGTVQIQSSEFDRNLAANDGGGLYVFGGTANVRGTLLDGNRAANGGGIYNDTEGTLLIGQSVLANNRATGSGGGLYDTGTLVRGTENTFDGNTASADGGGIAKVGTGELFFRGSIYLGNSADRGGAIFASAGDLRLDGGRASENTARLGGGVALQGSTTALFEGGFAIVDNTATLEGGGLLARGATTLRFFDGNVEGNVSEGDGGGLAIRDAKLDLRRAQISGNAAVGNGGGIYATGAAGSFDSLFLREVTASLNSAGVSGGGVFVDGPTDVTVIRGIYTNNTAVRGAGLFFLNDALVAMRAGTTVSSNTATANGGGIYASGSRVTIEDASIRNNRANRGAGLFVTGGRMVSLLDVLVAENIATDLGGGAFNARIIASVGTLWTNNRAADGGGVYGASGSRSEVLDDFFAGNVPNETAGPGSFVA